MAKLTEEAKKIISEFGPGLIATADANGKPNVSPKGSFRVIDDEHLIFADVRSPRTVANLRVNPQVSAIVLDRATRKGCRIWGRAEILNSGKLFDDVSAEYAKKQMKVNNLVKISVDDVVCF